MVFTFLYPNASNFFVNKKKCKIVGEYITLNHAGVVQFGIITGRWTLLIGLFIVFS